MKLLWTACGLVWALAAFSTRTAAALECGETTCEAGEMCIDRGGGERCYPLCRMSLDCETGCCLQIRQPFTAWICVEARECFPDADGDADGVDPPQDGDEPSDGDDGADGDGEEPSDPDEPVVCDDRECTRLERCAIFEDGEGSVCAPVCQRAFDCTSECCVVGFAADAVCMPLGIECPRDKRIKVDPACAAVSPPAWGSALLLLAVFALLARRARRRP